MSSRRNVKLDLFMAIATAGLCGACPVVGFTIVDADCTTGKNGDMWRRIFAEVMASWGSWPGLHFEAEGLDEPIKARRDCVDQLPCLWVTQGRANASGPLASEDATGRGSGDDTPTATAEAQLGEAGCDGQEAVLNLAAGGGELETQAIGSEEPPSDFARMLDGIDDADADLGDPEGMYQIGNLQPLGSGTPVLPQPACGTPAAIMQEHLDSMRVLTIDLDKVPQGRVEEECAPLTAGLNDHAAARVRHMLMIRADGTGPAKIERDGLLAVAATDNTHRITALLICSFLVNLL